MNILRKFFFGAFISAIFFRSAYAANVISSSDFAAVWNNGLSPIVIVGAPIDSANNYGIFITDYLQSFSGANMSISGGSVQNGTALMLGSSTLSFTPGWGNDMVATLTNMSIYSATNGAISFAGNGTGTHNFSVDGVFFYGNSTPGDGGAININAQIQSAADNFYILTDNGFSANSAQNGGAIYMAANNAYYSGNLNPTTFSVIDSNSTHYISLNNAAQSGGGIYFYANNADGGSVENKFTALGYNYYQNSAQSMGGAIYNGVINGNAPSINNFNITGGTFTQNQAANGGAIANEINGGNTDININIDGNFYSNLASQNGGAIWTAVGDQYSPYGGDINLNISGNFNANKSANGGAIYNNIAAGQSTLTMNLSGNITNNYASNYGGAIFNSGDFVLNIADGTLFAGNGASYGGAIYNSGDAIINLNTATNGISFANNYADSFANGSDIYQASANAVINILGSGSMNINGGIGGIGTINQSGGTTFNLGGASQSPGFTGIYNQASGATLNASGQMFGGQNNIGGTANINTGATSFYFNANMLSNSVMNFNSASTQRVSVGQAANDWSAGLNFVGSNADVEFATGSYKLLNDIQNGQSNKIAFNNSDVIFGSTNYTGTTNYFLNGNSTIDLAQSSGNYQAYNFASLTASSATALTLKIGNDQGSLMADTINVASGGGTINLGTIYVDDVNGILTGVMRVIYGSPLKFTNGEQQYVATSLGTYTITSINDQYIQLNSVPASGGGGDSGGSDSSVGPDGSTDTTTPNTGGGSTTTTTDPDGGSNTIVDDGNGNTSTITNNPDGSVDIDDGNGNITHIPPGGSGHIDLPGGGSVDVNTDPDGNTTTTITPPGGGGQTIITTDPNGGGSNVNNPDGSTAGTTNPGDGSGGTGSITKPTNPPSLVLNLNDVNSLDTDATTAGLSSSVARAWQIAVIETYYNDADLDEMATGTFSVYGASTNNRDSILSGLNANDQTTKQSLFKITADNTNFSLTNLTIQSAYSADGGSVLNMSNANSTATLSNLVIQNNSSGGDGGAVIITAGTSYSTNLAYLYNTATGNGGAIYNLGGINKHGGLFIGNQSGGNGGAIYNDSPDGTTIYAGQGGMHFTGNTAAGLGGAIYNAAGSVLYMASLPGADMILSGNIASGKPNDIYNEGELNFISTGGTFYIGSGIAGSGTINKYSPVVLELAATGDNSEFVGDFNQYNGVVNVDTKFFGGTNNIESGIVNWNSGASKLSTAIINVGSGTMNVYGTLRLDNPADILGAASTLNLFPGGLLEIAGGSVYMNTTDTVPIINGQIGLISQSDGWLAIGGLGMSVYSSVYKQTGGVLQLYNQAIGYLIGEDSDISGLGGGDIVLTNASVFINGYTLNFGAGSGSVIPTSGSLAMGDNALINSIDGTIQNHTFAGKFAIISSMPDAANSFANFAIDLDAQNFVSDKFSFSGTAMPGDLVINGNPAGGIDDIYAMDAVVMLTQLNLINSPRGSVVPFTIMESPNYDPSIVFATQNDSIITPAGTYGIFALGEGNYELRLQSTNSQAVRGGVAANSMMFSQLLVNGIMFDHIFLDSNKCLMCENAPWQFGLSQTGVWAKAYGGTDRMELGGGTGETRNVLYGGIAGLDLSVNVINRNWRWVPTIYMAYNGGQQKFGDVEIVQNGGQIGMQNSITDGEFIGAILTYAGFYNNNFKIGEVDDTNDNWFAGAGAKIAYDLRLAPEHMIIQPNFMVMYNYFGGNEWESANGSIDMETGYLSGLSIAPGLAFIVGTNWMNVHASGAFVMNFANDVKGRIGEIELPDLVAPKWFFEYGLGAVGNMSESATFEAKMFLRSGEDINGITGRIGATYRF